MSGAFRSARMLAVRATRMIQSRGMAAEAEGMKVTFAAANKNFYADVAIRQIDVPSFSGDFGILANHVPTLAVMKPGLVQVTENDGSIKKFIVSSGTITVNADSSVQVLAEEAHPIEDVDLRAAQDALSEAQRDLSSATTDKAKAEAMIAVEVAELIVRALQ